MLSGRSHCFLKFWNARYYVSITSFKYKDTDYSQLRIDVLNSRQNPKFIETERAVRIIEHGLEGPLKETLEIFSKFKERSFPTQLYRQLILRSQHSPSVLSQIMKIIHDNEISRDNDILGALLINNLKDTNEAIKILNEMLETNKEVPPLEGRLLIEKLIQEDKIETAIEIYKQIIKPIESKRKTIKTLDYYELIKTTGKNFYNKEPLYLFWYQELKRLNIPISGIISTQLLQICKQLSRSQDFYFFLDEIDHRQIPMITDHYAILFDVIHNDTNLTESKQFSLLQKYFEKLLSDLSNPQNSLIRKDEHWNSIFLLLQSNLAYFLNYFAKTKDATFLDNYLHKISSLKDIEIPNFVFSHCYETFWNGNHENIKLSLIRLLLVNNRLPKDDSVKLYNYHQLLCIYENNFIVCFRFYRRLLSLKLQPNIFIYSQLILTSCKSGEIQSVLDLLHSAHQHFLFTRSFYCNLIDVFIDLHHEDKIPGILNYIPNPDSIFIQPKTKQKIETSIQEISDFHPFSVEYQKVFEILESFMIQLMKNNSEELLTSIETLESLFLQMDLHIPTFIHCSIIRFIGKNHSLEQADEYFQRKISKKNILHYDAIIDCLFFHAKYHDILSIFNDLLNSNLIPSVSIFNHVFHSLYQNNQTSLVSEIVFKMQNLNVLFNSDTISILTSIYCDLNELELAEHLITSNIHNHYISESTLALLIEKLVNNSKIGKAFLLAKSLPDLSLPIIRPILRNIYSTSNVLQVRFFGVLKRNNVPNSDIILCFDTENEGKDFISKCNSMNK